MNPRILHQWRGFTKEASSVTSFLVKGFCFIHITTNYLFQFAYVYGPSMIPTFDLAGHLVVIDSLSRRRGKIGVGDVVVVCSPENPRKTVVKRLTGMEGDRVPKGHVWVQGDNVYDSRDSRQFGAVPYALLHGRVCWKVWPLKDFGPV